MQVVKQHKTKFLCYEIDEIATAAGHRILRLPPYYCQLNPIELIWAQVKQEIKKHNSNSNQHLKRVEELTIQSLGHVTPNNWFKCMEHTRKLEEDYRKKDIAFEHLFESFVIELSQSDTSSDECDEPGETSF